MTTIEMPEEDTQIQQDSDDEITEHHNLERQNLVDQVQAHAKKPNCRRMFCKGLILSVAGVLFILMMIQLWSDYGEFIQTQTFPPRLVSMGRYCKNNETEVQDHYKGMTCNFDTRFVCQQEKPSRAFVQTCPMSKVSWLKKVLVIEPYNDTECVDLVVWSI